MGHGDLRDPMGSDNWDTIEWDRDPMGGDNWDTIGWDMGIPETPWDETVGILREGTWGPQGPHGRGQLGPHGR